MGPPPKYLTEKTVATLRRHARDNAVPVGSKARKSELVSAISKHDSRKMLNPAHVKKMLGGVPDSELREAAKSAGANIPDSATRDEVIQIMVGGDIKGLFEKCFGGLCKPGKNDVVEAEKVGHPKSATPTISEYADNITKWVMMKNRPESLQTSIDNNLFTFKETYVQTYEQYKENFAILDTLKDAVRNNSRNSDQEQKFIKLIGDFREQYDSELLSDPDLLSDQTLSSDPKENREIPRTAWEGGARQVIRPKRTLRKK